MKKIFIILTLLVLVLSTFGQKRAECQISIDSFYVIKPTCDTCCNGSITCFTICGYPPFQYSWSLNNGFNTVASGQTFKNVCYQSTYIYCEITDSIGQRIIDSLLVSTVTQVQEINSSPIHILLYPNPSKGIFNFQLQGTNQKASIEVYNMLGEKVYQAPLNPPIGETSETTISLPNVEGGAGIYLYRIISEKGEAIVSGKLVIE